MTEAMAAWTEALHSVERSINEAAGVIRFLRTTVQQMAPLCAKPRWPGRGNTQLRRASLTSAPRTADQSSSRAPAPVPESGDEEEEEEPPIPRCIVEEVAPQPERDWTIAAAKARAQREGRRNREEAERRVTPPGPSRPALEARHARPRRHARALRLQSHHRRPAERRRARSVASRADQHTVGAKPVAAQLRQRRRLISLESTDEVQPPEFENAHQEDNEAKLQRRAA